MGKIIDANFSFLKPESLLAIPLLSSMRIILDLHILPEFSLPASSVFLTDMMIAMAARFKEDSFIFLVDRPGKLKGKLPDNMSIHYVNRQTLKWFGKKFWYAYRFPGEIAAIKADLLVTVDNLYVRKPGLPVCLFLIHHNAFLQTGGKRNVVKKSLKSLHRIITDAGTIVTFSETNQGNIQSHLSVNAAKIKLLKLQPVNTEVLKWTEKELVKIEFAKGMEYFLFAGDLHERFDLLTLLKAFSLFKKRQQSNMQLVMAGNNTSVTNPIFEKLASFKYRDDVHLLLNQPTAKVQRIIAGAYACVYPALYDYFPISILQAMQAEVPVISSPLPICEEWCGNSIMYPETTDAAGFAKSMQQMYKDERMRSGFIEAAKKRLATNNEMATDMVDAGRIFFREIISK